MIIFLSDWQKYDAIPHLTTKNRSFVHVCRIYKALGIKNHLWPLALFNPLLQGVDPHDPNISAEEIMMVTAEVIINPMYFFREVARAPGQSGAPPRAMEANRGNMALYWSFFNHIMLCLIQARQTGKSFSTDVLMAYLLCIKCRDTQINLLTKDEPVRRSNIQRLKDIIATLPYYLNPRSKQDVNNTEMITISNYGNLFQGHLPSNSKAGAEAKGRGLSSAVFVADETPFQANIDEALPAALAAGGAAMDIARAADAPFGTILTTTAGRRDSPSGAFIYKLISGMAVWNDYLFDSNDAKELERRIRVNSRDKEFRVNITMSHQQVGKTDAWLREKMAAAVSDGDRAARDFLNQWTAGNAANPLSPKQLEIIRGSQREPVFGTTEGADGYYVNWFIPEETVEARMRNSKFIVVLDTSDASGGDDISLRMTDIYTGELIATGTYNQTNILTFAEWVATWVIRWDSTTLLIERRSTGASVLDIIWLILVSKGIDPFARIFNRIVNDHDEMPDRYKEICAPMWRRPSDICVKNKKSFGFATSASGTTSRSELYSSTLHLAAKQVGHLTTDKITIDQIAGLIIKNGRVDHAAGEHDDMVISWILTHWFLTKAKNLQHYGINSAHVLRDLRAATIVAPIDLMKASVQQKLRARIEEVTAKFQVENDDFMSRRYESELRFLYSRVELQENEKFTIDELINKTKEEKLRKRLVKNDVRPDKNDIEMKHRQFAARYGANGSGQSSPVFGGWRR